MTRYSDTEQIRQCQYIFAANIAARMAAASSNLDDSARSWDQLSGYTDSTNSDHRSTLLTKNFKALIGDCSALFPTKDNLAITASLSIKRPPAQRKAITYYQGAVRTDVPKIEKRYSNLFTDWATRKEQTGKFFITTNFDCMSDSKEFVLSLTFASALDQLEREIPESIRKPLRERLKFLLDASIEEQSDEQDLLKIESLQAFYKFMEYCKSPSVPSLTLTWDGHIYAQWCESDARSLGARFLSTSRVDYVIQNGSEQFSASTNPSRLYRLLDSLLLMDLVTTGKLNQAA